MIYLELFLTFLKIGAFTFGGGYAMLKMIEQEVTAHGWLDPGALIDFVAVSESTPGPFAVNMATYVGSEVGGVIGSLCATFGVVLPSFVIIIIVAKSFERFKSSAAVKGCLSGLKPAVVGLIAAAVVSVGLTVFAPEGISTAVFSTAEFYKSAAIFVGAGVMAFKNVNPILIIISAAVAGILISC